MPITTSTSGPFATNDSRLLDMLQIAEDACKEAYDAFTIARHREYIQEAGTAYLRVRSARMRFAKIVIGKPE